MFDFIRCSSDKSALKNLIETDDYYKNMEEDAFDVAVQYTNATELIEAKEYYEKEGVVDMCKALTELIEDGREEGREEGRDMGITEGIALTKKVYKLQKLGKSNAEIAEECNIAVSQVEAILE